MLFVTYKRVSWFFFFLLALTSTAQENKKQIHLDISYSDSNIRIQIVDSATKLPIADINAQILTSINEIVRSGISNHDGIITFNHLPVHQIYYLSIFVTGYKVISGIKVKTGSEIVKIDLDIINYQLSELQIIADQDSVLVRGDTTSYNADLYRSQTDENVGDMVKKIPGSELKNGTLTIEGDKVTSVMLDGEEYFKSNNAVSIDQVPSDIISRIEVIDVISPEDPSQQSKIINIVTKKKDLLFFGKIASTYGDKDRYRAAGNYYLKTKRQRVTIMGDFNNINKEDLLAPTLHSLFDGDNRLNAGGLNYICRSEKEMNLDFNYYINSTNRFQSRLSEQHLIAETNSNPLFFMSENNTVKEILNSFDFRFSMPIKPRFSVKLESTGQLMDVSLMKNLIDIKDKGNASDYALHSTTTTDQKNNSLNTKLTFNYRFNAKKEKKVKFQSCLFSIENLNRTESIKDTIEYVYLDTINSNSWLLKNAALPSSKTKGLLQLTEKIGEKYTAKYSLSAEYLGNKNNTSTLLFDNMNYTNSNLDSSLSTINEMAQQKYRGTMNVTRRSGKTSILMGLSYEAILLDEMFFFPDRFRLFPTYSRLLPIFSIQYKQNKSRLFKITYSTRQNIPNFKQLNPIVDNSTPSRPSTGNTALESEYLHMLGITYRKEKTKNVFHLLKFNSIVTNNFIGEHLYMPVNDSIIEGLMVRRGTQFTKTENLKHNFQNTLTAFHEKTIPKHRYSLQYGITFDVLPNKLNETYLYTFSNRYNMGLSENFYPNKLISFSCRAFASYGRIYSSSDFSKVQSLFNWNASGSIRALFWKSLLVELESNSFQALSIGSSSNKEVVSIVNLSLKQGLFKNQKASLFVSIHDLFNQNTDITQNPSALYITREQKLMLGRYFFIGFAVKL